MIHELKTWLGEFEAVVAGRKRHEVRRADRDFQVDDLLILREWNPATESYTGRAVLRQVSYRTPGGAWGLPADVCVLSIK